MDKIRRELLTKMAGAAAMLPLVGAGSSAATTAAAAQEHSHEGVDMSIYKMGSEKIAMLMYDGMTALDLIGPQYLLGGMMGVQMYLVSKDGKPVTTDTGVGLVPNTSFDECPKDLDIFFVPGSAQGVLDTMEDEETIAFVKDRGERAKLITSVCTGSLILGRAGLLEGYKATSHWVSVDLLPLFGAIPVKERYVRDRNRITGGGVSAGLDFALSIIAELRGQPYAEAMQLLAEYDPQPPFNAGSPEKSPQNHVKVYRQMFKPFVEHVHKMVGKKQA